MPRHLRRPLTADLRAFTTVDGHGDGEGRYLVRSLYLDSLDWMCFFDKLAGLSVRCKLRIRDYPGAGNAGPVKFEVKYRRGQRITKDVATVDRATYERWLPLLHRRRMIDACFLEGSPGLRAFFHLKQLYAMAPIANVQFRRQAFFARSDRHVRITLDDALVFRRARDLFAPMPRAPLLATGSLCILEVKVERSIPYWLSRLIGKYGLQAQSVSKYSHAAATGPFGLDGLQ